MVATREYRFAFSYVPVQTDVAEYPSLARSNGDEVVEVRVPGAHSDIGGGYDEGLWKLSLAMSRALLTRQGLTVGVKSPALDAQSILNLGRHDSDWVKLPQAETTKVRQSVPIMGRNRPKHDMSRQLERYIRVGGALTRSLLPIGSPLLFKIDNRGDTYELTHNCQTRAFAVDVQSRSVKLDGNPFRRFKEAEWQAIETGKGILMQIEPEDPANWTLIAP